MIYLALVLALALGYVIGVLQKGIHINLKKDDESPAEYNRSYADPEVQDWLTKANKETSNFNG